MYIFPAVACQTPTDLAAHLAHSPYHRTRENGSPGATSSLHILPVTRKLVRAGTVRINRSRLIVNNRQIIRIQGRLPPRRFSIINTGNAGPQLPA